jgi:two-component system, cell cycle sensor histidine kinase and response regulator CckA
MHMQTILIVDEEPQVRRLLEHVLRSAGFSVLSAECGPEAISISQANPGKIALLITDVTLPGMTGWNLAHELAEQEPDIPVLFMSGGCPEVNFGGDAHSEFLAKPFSLSTLLLEVRHLLTQNDTKPAN